MKTVKRNAPSTYVCTLARALEWVGDGWSWLIIRDLFAGRSRFVQIQENLGIARNILTSRLERLTEAGIVERIPDRQGSKYPEYVLTEKGRDLLPTMIALQQWGERWHAPRSGLYSNVLDRRTMQPIPRQHLRDARNRRIPLDAVIGVNRDDPAWKPEYAQPRS